MLLIDIDHFKAYNDHYGHVAGDECLRQVAMRSPAAQAAHRRAARYGGEEFVLLLPDTPAAGALIVAETARTEVASLALPHAQSPTSPLVTFSAGMATYRPSATRHPGTSPCARTRRCTAPDTLQAQLHGRGLGHPSYMLRRYCPPTSNNAWVKWPSEQTRTASISTANTFSSLITACLQTLEHRRHS